MTKEGIIVAGVGGNYEVYLEGEGYIRCKARGIFRKQKQVPLIGDWVSVSEEHYLEAIAERKNALIRPAAANIDQVLVVFAVCNPQPHFMLLDRFLLEAGKQKIPVVIILNKADLWDMAHTEMLEEAKTAYQQAGYPVYQVSTYEQREADMQELRNRLQNKITVLAGPSGVGKSSLINALTGADQETGQLSEKIARGKNTTRHARLLPLKEGAGWIADTPGFSSFYMQEWSHERLAEYYPEFLPYLGTCRFPDCQHRTEPDCRVRQAVEKGVISRLRYENYQKIYEEIQLYQKEHPEYGIKK
ncbi:MAG: ribosome small subunit-dependent GTPase A [Lachnospiraceae bacterium]|jgi:ribosome biogenesis GTPase|nr:ribosome small subunit-dependent GTPase A [Lachnospiraceae bacterium]